MVANDSMSINLIIDIQKFKTFSVIKCLNG